MSETTKNPFEPFFEEIRRIVREEIFAALANGISKDDHLVDAEEAAKLLSVSAGWLYKNHARLPFVVKLHHKMLRFSYRGIQKHIAAKKT